ncbi:pyocin activator PrtN family protein [Breoghania sp. L-A4]|uniref:pyocin activator PrtN family protein n=1 Tax=Breoghania sp. L-A4 TaxID=2304600 RepID=UPI0032046EA8
MRRATSFASLAQKSLLFCGNMNTAFQLIAMYSGQPVISAEEVARDFFGLTKAKFVRKVTAGDIALPSFGWRRRGIARRACASTTSPHTWTSAELRQ